MIQIKPFFIAILLVVFVSSVNAQSKKDYVVAVTDVRVENNVRSPDFPSQIDNKKAVNPKQWTVVFVDYTVEFPNKKASKVGLDDGLWLDTVSVQWEFLYKPKKAPNKIESYIRFDKAVKYTNVKKGKHTALMFFDPIVLERFFDAGKSVKKDLIMKFSLKANGYKEPKGTVYYSSGKIAKSKDVAKLNGWFEFDRFKRMENIAKSRNETPFKNIQYDLYNPIQPEK